MTSGKSLTKHEVTQKVLRARGGVQKKGWGWGGGGWVGSQLRKSLKLKNQHIAVTISLPRISCV